ncbi:MAG: beta strand repeat-containing protein, partial [Planctomycetota bacterium]
RRICTMARLRPSLEGLNERIVPAVSVKFLGGSLTITANPANVSNNLVVTQQATDGKFVISDGGVSVGPYRVTGNITITSSNASDTIQVNLNRGAAGTFQLPGFLSINSRNGADTITINSDATRGGRIGGNLILATGFSDDTVNIGTAGGALSIGGAVSANMDSGADTFNLGTTSTGKTFVTGRGVTLLRANTVNMGTGTDPLTVNGTVSIDNTLDYGITNNITLGFNTTPSPAKIAGNFCYNGGTLIDDIKLYGTVQGAPGKNSVINMGQGANTLDIDAVIGLGTSSDLIVTGGAGIDDISLGDDTDIANDAIFSLGAGNNVYGLNGAFTVGGDMSITAGNGDDIINLFAGQIGGDLTLSLGNGSNSLTFTGASTVGAAQSASCHDFTYNGGDGDDEITFDADNGAVENSLTVNLGSGSDIFDATNSNDSSYLTGFIDLGLDLDPDQVTYRSALAAVTEIVNIFPNDTVTAV